MTTSASEEKSALTYFRLAKKVQVPTGIEPVTKRSEDQYIKAVVIIVDLS